MRVATVSGRCTWGDVCANRGCAVETVRVLGGFSVAVEGSDVRLGSASQTIVAYLAVHGQQPVGRMRLAAALEPDASEVRARNELRSRLWRLKRRGLVDLTPSGVRLAPGVVVDADHLVSAAATVRSAPLERLSPVPFAAGDLLPEWVQDWVLIERERLRQLRIHALECVSERLLGANRLELAALAAREAVRADPARESATRLLMDAEIAMGNLATALAHGSSFLDVATRVGAQPSHKFKERYARCTREQTSG